jgi:acetyl esterase
VALHPQAKVICDAANAVEPPARTDENLELMRTGYGGILMLAGEAQPVFAVEDRDADGVPVRVYRPSPEPDLPVVVYLHGGGWTIGNVEQYDAIVRQVANASEAIVVAPEYRLAPEHPFPAPLDDCWHTVQWTAKNAASFGADPGRLALMGDSAGGNMSAVCALLARDAGTPDIAMQVLLYPVTDCDFTTPSYSENREGYLLSIDEMEWFFSCYTRGGADATDWRISPNRASDVSGVAPALVVTAEYDPLRDEGEAYARRLQDAGVPVEVKRYEGMVHAFFGLSAAFDASRDALDLTGTALRRAFGTLER